LSVWTFFRTMTLASGKAIAPSSRWQSSPSPKS
jgi:hypothetical protein